MKRYLGNSGVGLPKWKQGTQKIGERSKFWRSGWEVKYAKYLQWMKENGQIKDWDYETKTFWFDAIKRGTRSYKPDFEVTLNNGSVEYHEVKGWMDPRSLTKIKRMKKYHPDVVLKIIDKTWFNSNKNLSMLIPGWDS